MVEMADPHVRLRKKLRARDHDIHVCTPNYRPPDVTLGSQRWGEDFDMWSFGCVAAELYLRQPIIDPPQTAGATAAQEPSSKPFVDAIAAIVGRPGQEADADVMPACAASWLQELPFFQKWYGQSGLAWLTASAAAAKAWPPPCLEGCPEGLVQLVQKCLVWHPSARMTIAEAKKTTVSCSRLARCHCMSAWPRSLARTASERYRRQTSIQICLAIYKDAPA